MFQVLYEQSPGRMAFKLVEDMMPFSFAFDAGNPWKFAREVADGVKKLEPFLEHLRSHDEERKHVERILNGVMADAFWYATRDVNKRSHCDKLHRNEIFQIIESIRLKK